MVKRGQALLREQKTSPPRNAAEPKLLPFFCRNLSRCCQVKFVAGQKTMLLITLLNLWFYLIR
jgi:hypothetical protein